MTPDINLPTFEQGQVRQRIYFGRLTYKGWIFCTACGGWLRRRAKGRHARNHERAGWPMLNFAMWRLPVHGTDIVVGSES